MLESNAIESTLMSTNSYISSEKKTISLVTTGECVLLSNFLLLFYLDTGVFPHPFPTLCIMTKSSHLGEYLMSEEVQGKHMLRPTTDQFHPNLVSNAVFLTSV